MPQQLMRMKLYTNSQITPELLQLGHWELDLYKIPETSLSPPRPGTVCERSMHMKVWHTAHLFQNLVFTVLYFSLCFDLWLLFIESTVNTERSCMRRSFFSRSKSWSSFMKNARGSLKSKARSRTSSGLAQTSRYFTHIVNLSMQRIWTHFLIYLNR